MKSKIQEFLSSKTFMVSKRILFILLLATAAFPFQNCGTPPDDEVPTDTTTKHDTTTKPKVTPINYFKFNGAEIYNLNWDSSNMYGSYKVSTNTTTIMIEGLSSHTTTKNETANILITFPGKVIGGPFKYSVNPIVNLEVSITRGSITDKYIYDNQVSSNDMIVNITKYDPVGGHIKGTFSGNLAFGITTATISSGAFEVVRGIDE